jgi:carbamoyl-phosphate synthase large subunit
LELDTTMQTTLLPKISPSHAALVTELEHPTDLRLFYLFAAFQQGWSLAELHAHTQISLFFLRKLQHLWTTLVALQSGALTASKAVAASRLGFTAPMIAQAADTTPEVVAALLPAPVYKMVDTCAGEFASETPYFYSTAFPGENESQPLGNSIVVIGSGPIRIGQGVEFDYTTVHCVQAIQAAGYHAIIVNNNPETVSTDFSISDKLYFEPLTTESVMHIIDLEQPLGVIVQFGGQTAINLTESLVANGVNILGTSLAGINQTEDRHEFETLLAQLHINQPKGDTAMNLDEARQIAPTVGYPVMVRPSYVLGGRAMAIVHDESELEEYVQKAMAAAPHQPILIDHDVQGMECEVDILSDGHDVFIPGIMEHLEGAGVHSGDSIAIFPPQHLTSAQQAEIVATATAIGKAVHCVGMMNVQFIVADQLYVIDVNPRASRTVPFMSKVTDYPLAKLATNMILGQSLADLHLTPGIAAAPAGVAIKAPVFSFTKLPGMATGLAPEMKSTGETIGLGATYPEAMQKALYDSYHCPLPQPGDVLLASAAPDASLSAQLAAAGLTVHVFTGDNPAIKPWAVLNADAHQDTASPLNYYALSHQVPLLTSPATLRGLLAV